MIVGGIPGGVKFLRTTKKSSPAAVVVASVPGVFCSFIVVAVKEYDRMGNGLTTPSVTMGVMNSVLEQIDSYKKQLPSSFSFSFSLPSILLSLL